MTNTALDRTTTELKPKSGLEREDRREVSASLARALADSYLLFINTQGLHWNVQGPLFYSVHKLTEEQYTDLFNAIDELAERIRALGFPAPQSIEDYRELSSIESLPKNLTVRQTIEVLVRGNEACARRMRDGIQAAENVGDVMSADLMTARIGQHEENAWMLRALIADG